MAGLRSMRNRIEHGRPHLEVVSGDIASFSTDMVADLKALKVHFYCQQSGSGTPSPTNVRPISGWSGLDIFRDGKNLVNPIEENVLHLSSSYNNYILSDGVVTTTGDVLICFLAPCKPNTEYTYSYDADYSGTNLSIRVYEYATLPTTIAGSGDRVTLVDLTRTEEATFTTTAAARYLSVGFYAYSTAAAEGITIRNFQLELGSTATEYTHYDGTKNSVLFPSEVAGGYIDLTTGEIWATQEKIRLIDYTWNFFSSNVWYISRNARKANTDILSSELTPRYNGSQQGIGLTEIFVYKTTATNIAEYLMLRNPDYPASSDRAGFNQWLAETHPDAEVVYELNEPVYVGTVDPITLKTLRGQNNIWSNSNGETEVKFWTH